MGKIVRLLDRQAIHIGPQPDRAFRIAGAQPTHDTGFPDPAEHLPAELAEPAGDEIGGSVLFEPEFGTGVDVVPPFCQIVMKLADALDDLMSRSLIRLTRIVAEPPPFPAICLARRRTGFRGLVRPL
jgi:hypothetical protein